MTQTAETVKDILRDTRLYRGLTNWRESRAQREWERRGKTGAPPNCVKQATVASYARTYGVKVFIETGTFLGDMLYASREVFDRLESIELSPELCARSRKRLRDQRHIVIHEGDSKAVLPSILARLEVPALFWLDAHYSAGMTARGSIDTPISAELQYIFDHKVREHIILIDDARHFDGTHDYPSIPALRDAVQKMAPGRQFFVENDIIRIIPARLSR